MGDPSESEPPWRVAGAVLAAGAGRRMGSAKADLVVDGTRLLDRAVAALRAGGCDPILAVVRARTAPARVSPTGVALEIVNPDPARGQRSSLALAVAGAAGAFAGDPTAALAVLLVDAPGVGADAVRATIAAWRPGRIAAACYRGRRGHPIVMAVADWELALDLAGPDEGARALLAVAADRVDEIAVEGDPTDLDTPEDLVRWLIRRR